MNKKTAYGTAAFLIAATAAAGGSKPAGLPNIVIIFTDDQGYGDTGVFGATGFDTPNLDRMAGEGMIFTSFYSGCAVCSPSRASLLTGCYHPRVGVSKVLFPYDSIGLNPTETTIAELLKQKNYATAIVGKWHLGHHPGFLPLRQGFDEYFGLPYSNDMWPVHYDGKPITRENVMRAWKLGAPPLPLMEGNEKVEEVSCLEDQDMLTTRYTERAVDFIGRNRNKPFLLYLAHTMPHAPLGVSGKFRGKSSQGMYGDVMMEIDWSVGEILRALEEAGIEENTLVIFTTDNGPALGYGNHGGSAGRLRAGKGSVFEGGFRVPCIMRWPSVIPEGTVCHRMAATIDILPTLAEITGTELPDAEIDGVSILPLLKGDIKANPRKEYFYYAGQNLRAVRKDEWKLVFPHNTGNHEKLVPGRDGFPAVHSESMHFEGGLYDLRRDPGERYDCREQFPEVVKELEVMADAMRILLGDKQLGVEGKENRPPGRVGNDGELQPKP